MFQKEISQTLDKKLSKLGKKNRQQLFFIDKKISEIIKNPYRFKNLVGGDMKSIKRVHIDKHFVLIFEVDRALRIVRFLDFDHHDTIYSK
jgi:YafQ family addiction module toxin component